MPRGRTTEIELNFDGLTDSLTNLVGTLILFVFLMFVLTRESSLPQTASGFRDRAGGAHSIDKLLQRAAQLQSELQVIDQQIEQQATALPQLRHRIEVLVNKTKNPSASANP